MRQHAAKVSSQNAPSPPRRAAARAESGGIWSLSRVPSHPRAPGIQCKLKVGGVDDPAEAEADRIADRAMRTPDPILAPITETGAGLRRKCAGCEEEAAQRSADAPSDGFVAEPAAESAVRRLGSGSELPPAERDFFEARLGTDLSHVRIHTGAPADMASRALGARAFTLGGDVAFAGGEYRPGSADGRRLLAHELVHVAQQTQGDAAGAVRRQARHRPPRGRAAARICGRTSQRVPGNHITKVAIDLSHHQLAIEWHDPSRAPPLPGTGPPLFSPGAGRCCLDCNDEVTSGSDGSLCTPKGTWKVWSTGCQLGSHSSAKNPTYFQRPGVAIHSGNTLDPPQSHGCVRTTREVSALIHDNVIVGSTTIAVSGTWTPLHCYMREADERPVNWADVCSAPGARPRRRRTPPARRPDPHGGPRAGTEVDPDRRLAEVPSPGAARGGDQAGADAPAVANGEAQRGGDGPGPRNEPVDEVDSAPSADAGQVAVADVDEEESDAGTG